jgi:hypothetical protein
MKNIMTTARHDYSVILRATNAIPEILIVTTPEGASLPCHENPMHFWQSIESVNQALLEKQGLQVTTIRCLEPMVNQGENQSLINVYLHLYHSGNLAANMRWIAIDKLPSLNLPDVINNMPHWIEWLQSDQPQRQTWYRLDGVQQIIATAKTHFGVEPQQLRSWERSAVWRIPTEQGNIYLKAVPPMFSFEPALTKWLYERFPENSTPTLAWSQPNQMLMADYRAAPLANTMPIETYENAFATYARIQVELCQHQEELQAFGVPYRSVQWIADHLDDFFAADANLRRGRFPLTAEEVQTLCNGLPRFKEACDVLSHSQIPDSLEHGDFWFGQIMIRHDTAIITDWSDSAITCPLFSLPFFLAEPDDIPQQPDAAARITDAYLDVWKAFASRETLDKLMPHVALLSPLYTAMRYHFDILPQMEIQWEMENMVSYNLRLLLRALA